MPGETEAATALPPVPDCPFYGRYMALTGFDPGNFGGQPITILPGLKDQCAIAFDLAAPCDLALQRKTIHWRDCPIWQRVANQRPRGT